MFSLVLIQVKIRRMPVFQLFYSKQKYYIKVRVVVLNTHLFYIQKNFQFSKSCSRKCFNPSCNIFVSIPGNKDTYACTCINMACKRESKKKTPESASCYAVNGD